MDPLIHIKTPLSPRFAKFLTDLDKLIEEFENEDSHCVGITVINTAHPNVEFNWSGLFMEKPSSSCTK